MEVETFRLFEVAVFLFLLKLNNNIVSIPGQLFSFAVYSYHELIMIKNVLLVKGYGMPHENRWQQYEEQYAHERGLHVAYPKDIPDFIPGARPTVNAFREFILRVIEQDGLEPDRTVVLAHSLGGNGWLRILQERSDLRTCLTTFLATPRDNHTGLDEVDDFFPTPAFADLTDEERDRMFVVGSDNDRVIHEFPFVLGAHLSTAYLTIPNAGHFMPRVLHGNPSEMDLGPEWMKIRQWLSKMHLPY